MISKFKSITNSKISWVIVVLIAIPFVFWGMGDVFTRGNTNNVAKINNNTISISDFINHINETGLNEEIVRENIDKNILSNKTIIALVKQQQELLGNNGRILLRPSGTENLIRIMVESTDINLVNKTTKKISEAILKENDK